MTPAGRRQHHNVPNPSFSAGGGFFMVEKKIGFERPLRKRAGGTFLGRGKIHGHANAPIPGVGACPYVCLFFRIFWWKSCIANDILSLRVSSLWKLPRGTGVSERL